MPAGRLPKYDKPPVVETAMGVQFARIQSFSTPMVGWFWKSYLDPLSAKKWERPTEVPRLEDTYERFGDKELWGRPSLRMTQSTEPNRVQIVQSGRERMVQVQDSRFVLNWRKGDGPYPTYAVLSNEFWSLYPRFEKFLQDAELGTPEQNQWEVMYSNHIRKGELWETTADWGKIIPRLIFPPAAVANPVADPITMDWRYEIPPERGRLYVGLVHARSGTDSSSEFMQLNLIARGSIDREKGWDLRTGFDIGHEAIVCTFAAMTSEEAGLAWKKRTK